MDPRPHKRAKLDDTDTTPPGRVPVGQTIDAASERASGTEPSLRSISRPISPPGISRSPASTPQAEDDPLPTRKEDSATRVFSQATVSSDGSGPKPGDGDCPGVKKPKAPQQGVKYLQSPFKLTSIRDLPPSHNNDTISLHDILGNPLIKEAWVFNFHFDVDWMMTHFDPDIRQQVKVKIVHGSWRSYDRNGVEIKDACGRWPNVEEVIAFVPDSFGIHHCKMFILLTHDDLCQVVIHTANMIPRDWTNMTQAVWQSPHLRLNGKTDTNIGNLGSGSRFKHDLLCYLSTYGWKTRSLLGRLELFDFSPIRGALIASVPKTMDTEKIKFKTPWEQQLVGYPSLFHALKTVSSQKPNIHTATRPHPHVVCQISSIATLPTTWLDQFFPILAGQKPSAQMWDHISIIYPTPSNVAASLDGYASGGSIHTKAQSTAHLKQITNLRKSLCQWTQGPEEKFRAGRDQAAPHIKTYVSFSEKPTSRNPTPDIDWALLTSANLSTQAWGRLREKENEIIVQSFELGVFVWPELFDEGFDTGEKECRTQDTKHEGEGKDKGESVKVRMVPVFGGDMPEVSRANGEEGGEGREIIVGLRLPYDLPLTPYGDGDMPWSPHGTYNMPDRHGYPYRMLA